MRRGKMKNKIVLFFLIIILSVIGVKGKVLELKISAPIHSITEEYIIRGIEYGNMNGFSLIVLKLDTPGGLDTSMRKIIKAIVNSEVPIAVFVYPSGARAASAGFFILLSADIAVMAKGTNTGAAHPVSISGKGIDKTMGEKILNDASAYIKNLAIKRGRNEKLAELAVRQSKSYMDSEALKEKLIDYIVSDTKELIEKINGKKIKRFNGQIEKINIKDKTIEYYDMSWRQKFLNTLANPSLAYMLLMLGLLGLYFEFNHPGGIIPGILGAIFLLLAAMAFQVLPINYTGLFLIILSIILFIAEIKVQGFGILGISGVISLILGSIILVDAPVKEMRMSLSFVLPLSIVLSAIFVLILMLVIRTYKTKIKTGEEGIIGEIGEAVTNIKDKGKVFVHGEWWNAKSDEMIKKGSKIIVIEKNGMILKVKEYNEE
jgi:membrane-bound serine protease (ClpP class)